MQGKDVKGYIPNFALVVSEYRCIIVINANLYFIFFYNEQVWFG